MSKWYRDVAKSFSCLNVFVFDVFVFHYTTPLYVISTQATCAFNKRCENLVFGSKPQV